MGDKIKILWMSDSPNAATGYGTVGRNVLGALNEDPRYDIKVIAWQFLGQPANVDGLNYLPPGKKLFAEDMLQKYLDEYKPDILITLCDLFMLMYMTNPKFNLGNTKFMPYFACDGFPLPNGTERVLEMATLPISMAKYGQQVAAVKNIYPDLLDKYTSRFVDEEGLERPNIFSKLIYHGYDDEVFKPIAKEEKEKFKESQGFGGKFIIGSVGRNQGRKYYVRMFQAIKRFMKNPANHDTIFYFHTDPRDPQGTDLINVSKVLKVDEWVRFTDYDGFHLGVSDEFMCKMYNIFDVHSLSTTGEGFGLPIIESMGCAVPNVLPDYTTTKELIKDSGIAVPLDTIMTGTWMVQRGFVDIDKLVEAWQYYHDNRDKCVEHGWKAWEIAQDFHWKKIIPLWKEAIEQCLGSVGGKSL